MQDCKNLGHNHCFICKVYGNAEIIDECSLLLYLNSKVWRWIIVSVKKNK